MPRNLSLKTIKAINKNKLKIIKENQENLEKKKGNL